MEIYALVTIAAALLVLLALLVKLRNRNKFEVNDLCFTTQERFLYGMLCQAVTGKAIVLGKLAIEDVTHRNKPKLKKGQKAFKKISARYFDFIIYDPIACSIVAVINIDYKDKLSVKESEILKDLCCCAEIKLIYFKLEKSYDVNAIFSKIYPDKTNTRLLKLTQTESEPVS